MDPELQKKIDAARAEGYTDDEINAYLGLRSAQQQAQQQGQPVPPDVAAQPDVNRRQQEQTAVGQGAALLGAGAAATGLAGVGAYKVAKPLVGMAAEAMRGAVNRPAPMPPAAPAAPVAPSALVDQYGRPLASAARAPVAPSAMPAAPTTAAQPNMIQRGAEYVRQMAMNRIVPAAGQMVRGGGIAGAALYSPELGPKVPTVGRMRGMEINPLTRQPWTPDQLAAYERNPQQFDSQLPPAQMPR